MAAPAYSVFSATSELLVTVAVLYVVWTAWQGRGFRRGLLVCVLVFEATANISYMAYRMAVPSQGLEDGPAWLGPLAAIHGLPSLSMFLFLILLTAAAWRDDREGRNFFREQPGATWSFVALWLASVASGEALFVGAYL